MDILDRFMERARAAPRRIVFPETDDPRIGTAMEALAKGGICVPVSVSDPTDAQRATLIDGRGVKPALADRMLSKPLIRAAAMVAAGEADAMIAGAANPTRRVIEAAGLGIGLLDGIAQPSSFFLMRFPDGRDMVWSDCAVTVDPDAAALTGIAQASAASARALLGEARVALLSFSTGTSGTGDSVDKVRAAAEATGFTGPVQADAALNAGIAAKKGVPFDDPNVLIFPSLDAANIAYKLAQELAGAQSLGPFLQGFRRPVCDLSRGASVDDIVKSTVVISALA